MELLKLVDSDLNEYNFDETFGVSSDPFTPRSSESERAYSHGVKDTSDGKIDKRIITVIGQVYGETVSQYRTNLEALYAALYKQDQKLYKTSSRYINVKKAIVTNSLEQNNFPRLSNVSIQFICEDPFWYSPEISEDTESISETPHEWNVSNGGDIEVYPIITITNSGSYASLSLKNKTDGNSLFTYDDSNLESGASVVIDCNEGTVYLSTTNTIRYLSGSFLRLLKGINTLELTGLDNASVKIEFYWRYL
jgi:phage-related protein